MTTRAHALRNLVLITILALAVLVGLGFWLAKKQGAFDDNLSLNFSTASGQHLSNGMKVVYQGFAVGQVKALELTPTGQFEGRLMVREKYRGLVTEGSTLELATGKLVGAELVLKKHASNTAPMQSGQSIEMMHFDLAHELEKKILDKIDPAVARVMAMTGEVLDPNKGLPATLNHINNTLVSTEKLLNGLNARAQDPRVDHLLTHLDEASASVVRNANLTEKTMQHTHQVLGSTQQVLESANGLVQNTNQTLQDFRSTTLGRWLAPARAPQAASSAAK